MPLKKKLKLKKKTKKQKNTKSSQNEKYEYEKGKTLEILGAIKPGLALRDIAEGMKNFYFDGKNVSTYNDKVSITHPFKTDFQSFINAEKLYKLISKLPSKKFTLNQLNETTITLKSEGVDVSLPAIIDQEVIKRISTVNKGIKKIEWKKLPSNFADCINLCSFAASSSEIESTISCVRLTKKVCVATDAKRIAYAKLKSKIEPMFIKASEIKHLLGIKPTHYGSNKGWLFFKNEDNCVFSIRKIDGNFPKWKHHFDFDGSKVDLPKKLLNGIDLASIFTEDGSIIPLNITIKKGVCKISVQTDGGKLNYSEPIDYNGEPIHFIVNPDFLKEMIKFDTTITFIEGRAKLETENFAVLTSFFSENDE